MYFLAMVYTIQVTMHFGWNATPESDNEFVIEVLILIFAALVYIADLLERLQKEAA
jgi:hypothetical protein